MPNSIVYNSTLGSGVLFPIVLKGGAWRTETSIELIRNNLIHILCHEPGERIRQENLASSLWKAVDEQYSNVLVYKIRKHVADIITSAETRVVPPKLSDINVISTGPSSILISSTLYVVGIDETLDFSINLDGTL